MPGTVTHGRRGRWASRIDFNAAHWQEWRYCPDAGGAGVAEVGGRTGQDLGSRRRVAGQQRERATSLTPPNPLLPPPAAGTTTELSCTGSRLGPWKAGPPAAGPRLLRSAPRPSRSTARTCRRRTSKANAA